MYKNASKYKVIREEFEKELKTEEGREWIEKNRKNWYTYYYSE